MKKLPISWRSTALSYKDSICERGACSEATQSKTTLAMRKKVRENQYGYQEILARGTCCWVLLDSEASFFLSIMFLGNLYYHISYWKHLFCVYYLKGRNTGVSQWWLGFCFMISYVLLKKQNPSFKIPVTCNNG